MSPSIRDDRFDWESSAPSAPDPNAGKTPPNLPGIADGQPSKAVRKKRKGSPEKLRRVALFFTLALVFIRFSLVHQLLDFLLHVDLYLLWIVGIPVLLGIFAAGAFKRALVYTPAKFWIAFALWLIPTSLFSTWRTGSLGQISFYYRSELVLLFAIGGLVLRWREFRWLLYTIAAAALTNVVSVLLFRQLDQDGRTSLAFGTVSNSNDYAAHLLCVLPFVLWVALTTKNKSLRVAALVTLATGLFEILASGSRGALLGVVAALVLFVFSTNSRTRRIVLITAPVLAVLVFALLPRAVVHRIFLFSADDSEISKGAIESSDTRQQLLINSIKTTIQHPLFGVGPSQFSNYEGQRTAGSGHALWLGAHNSFTQIASENGIPGFIFFLAAILSSLLLLHKLARYLSRFKPPGPLAGLQEAKAAIVCVRVGFIAFCVAIFFVNFSYFFYLPAFSGIVIALATSCKSLMAESALVAARPNSKPVLQQTQEVANK